MADPNKVADMHADCPFCTFPAERYVAEYDLVFVIRDGFPVSPGHTLIIPRRHVPSLFGTTEAERVALFSALDAAKATLDAELNPDGYNIGINDGAAAGQTVGHLHVHLIPRYSGDRDDPRGGIRWIFPQHARYWKD